MKNSKIALMQIADATRVNTRDIDKKCTKEEEDSESKGRRVPDCSSMSTCYNFDSNLYDNTNCPNPAESCAKFKTTTKELEGCMLSKYCGTTNEYIDEEMVKYNCPDGVREYRPWEGLEMSI